MLSQETEAWIKATSQRFAKRLVQEAAMSEARGPNMSQSWLNEMGARLERIQREELAVVPSYCERFVTADLIASECDIADELAVIVIRYEDCDPIIHTDDLPWCDDPDCACHYDFTVAGEAEYHAIIEQPLADGLLTEPEAARIYDGKQV